MNLSRAFLDTNGAHQETDVKVAMPDASAKYFDEKKDASDVKWFRRWKDNSDDCDEWL